MTTRTFLLLLLLAAAGDDGPGQGRRGNQHYQQRQYAQAAAAYRAGLGNDPAVLPGPVPAGLSNNLGAALYRQQDYARAQEAFTRSMRLASNDLDFSRAAYNAGNTAFTAGDLETALDFYRQALRRNPQNADARFNYEYLRRQMQQQRSSSGQTPQQNPQQSPDQNPGQNPEPQPNQQDQQGQQNQQPQPPQPDQSPQPDQQGEPDQKGEPDPSDTGNAQATQQEPNRLSRQQAEQLLQALENEEEQLLRQARKLHVPPRPVEKDW